MKPSNVLSFVAFAYFADAFALENRAVCANNCGRAVAATNKGIIFAATARKDCSKNAVIYTTVLVTPTPLTSIQTSTVQASASSTATVTTLSSSTITLTSLVTSTTIGATTTSTFIEPAVKRDFKHKHVSEAGKFKRVVASSTSQTIPTYASACSNFAEYTAACSCIGVTATRSTVYSTLPAVTSTSVQTVTTTSTATLVQTVASEIDVTVTETATTTTVIPGPTTTLNVLPPYCSAGPISGRGLFNGQYQPQCGVSYAGLPYNNGESSKTITATSYTACLNQCDSDANCLYFSYFLLQTVNNCILIDAQSANRFLTPTQDQNVNSGYFMS